MRGWKFLVKLVKVILDAKSGLISFGLEEF